MQNDLRGRNRRPYFRSKRAIRLADNHSFTYNHPEFKGEYQMDTTSENIKRLNLELKNEERHLREDLTEIKSKIQAARTELSPSKLIEQRLLPISGLVLALGFALGSRGHSVKGF